MVLRQWRLNESYKWVHDRRGVVSLQEGDSHASLPVLINWPPQGDHSTIPMQGAAAPSLQRLTVSSCRQPDNMPLSMPGSHADCMQGRPLDYSSLRCRFGERAQQATSLKLHGKHQVASEVANRPTQSCNSHWSSTFPEQHLLMRCASCTFTAKCYVFVLILAALPLMAATKAGNHAVALYMLCHLHAVHLTA